MNLMDLPAVAYVTQAGRVDRVHDNNVICFVRVLISAEMYMLFKAAVCNFFFVQILLN